MQKIIRVKDKVILIPEVIENAHISPFRRLLPEGTHPFESDFSIYSNSSQITNTSNHCIKQDVIKEGSHSTRYPIALLLFRIYTSKSEVPKTLRTDNHRLSALRFPFLETVSNGKLKTYNRREVREMEIEEK